MFVIGEQRHSHSRVGERGRIGPDAEVALARVDEIMSHAITFSLRTDQIMRSGEKEGAD